MAGHSKWANIKHKKSRMDEKRGKIFTKIGREIFVAVKQGGPDPEANPRLKTVLQKARENNMPNDNIQRIIQRASGDLDTTNYEELVYEGYGPAGVAVLINIMTDNRNRTAGEIRHIFSKNGGNLGETGCVAWMFDTKGVISINPNELNMDADELMLLAIEAGAEDIVNEDETIQIYTSVDDFENVKNNLTNAGIPISSSEITKVPQNTVLLTDLEQAQQVLKLLDLLEDNDDVQAVYANFEIASEIADQVS
ncbi:MAG: YebC/PmpR family DNA-binding transcriptional regulator [Zhaonellaceae bacterium]|jgi:YebC/PmpR family DNA-binding regulatory protein|nr:YebC/PmpR family DNA-binding transcriptional regulator [Clostridia bacterium]